MNRLHDPCRLNLPALAHEEKPLADTTPLSKMQRLVQELQGLEADFPANLQVQWQAKAELRNPPGQLPNEEGELWLRLEATAQLPMQCQRCLHPVDIPLQIDQWFRFVATEEVAMAEDDDCEEDLLVLEPQFDILALLEDELLMALPLVPMHEACPEAVASHIGFGSATPGAALPEMEPPTRPNPFAALAGLKKRANEGSAGI